MSNGLDDRLARLALEMAEPSADATRRARGLIMATPVTSSPRRSLRSVLRAFGRPVPIAAAVAGFALVGGVLAVLVVVTPDEAPPPGVCGSASPDPLRSRGRVLGGPTGDPVRRGH